MKPMNFQERCQMCFGDVDPQPGYEFVRDLPPELLLYKAQDLFLAAMEYGFFYWDSEDTAEPWKPLPGITRGQIAYWCKKASTYLGLDKRQSTNWALFERVFGHPEGIDPMTGKKRKASHPLRYANNNIKQAVFKEELMAPIDDFFNNLNNKEDALQHDTEQ